MVNSTWKGIKEAFEKAGVRDEDEVLYIDVGSDWHFTVFELAQKWPRIWTIWS